MEVTVVSFLPWALNEMKPGLIPESYYIPPCVDGIPGVLHVKDAVAHLYIRDGKTFPVTFSAEGIGEALVGDYWRAQLQASDEARPAMFWLYGKLSPEEVLGKHKEEVAEAKKRQNVWFMRLVRLADDDWVRFQQHRMITDLQRYAAQNLGMINKPWMKDLEPSEFVKCPACSTLVDVKAAVCANCGFITNKVKAKELGIEGNKLQTR